MRAVLDANVLVSAALSPQGAPARIVQAWLDGEFELVASPSLLDELERVLAYPKLRKRIPTDDAVALVRLIASATVAADPDAPPPVAPPDPDDAYLVALAADRRAILVTGDAGLLELGDRIPVMAPADFIQALGLAR